MQTTTRIAVLGVYNSGSTAVAGLLHRLGVDMGAPFWRYSDDDSPENYYEPLALSRHLRAWWHEPYLHETADRMQRIAYLMNWVRLRECLHPGPVGAKHPLLALSGDEIIQAWGTSVLFLRVWRPLAESVERLRARRWFPGLEEPLQRTLWDALETFCSRQAHLQIPYQRLCSDTTAVLEEIVAYTNLAPTTAQREAAAFIH